MKKSPAVRKRMLYGGCKYRGFSSSYSHVNFQAMQATMPCENGDKTFLEDNEDEDVDNDELLSDPDAGGSSSVKGEEEPEIDSDGNELDNGISLAEGSDDDDLVAVDDISNGLIEYDGLGAETEQSNEEWGGIGGSNKCKQKDNSQARHKKRKTLPTFATYEEYARMIKEGPEDQI